MMAEVVTGHEFTGGNVKYDWAAWLDGQQWRLRRGSDFAIEVTAFRSAVLNFSWRNGMRTATSVLPDNKTIYVQYKGKRECSHCGMPKHSVRVRNNPYLLETEGIKKPVMVCEDCYDLIAMEI